MKEEIIRLENSLSLNVKYSQKQGEAILFLHFSSGNLHMWDSIIPMFEASYTVVAPELRGHGKSDKPLKGYHIDDMAGDVYLLLKQLGIAKCHVVGSSLGAEAGLSLASSHPEMVLSLVCEGAFYNEFGELGIFQGNADEIEKEKERRREARRNREWPVFSSKDKFIEEEINSLKSEGLWNEHMLPFIENRLCKTEDGSYIYCYSKLAAHEYAEHYWNTKFEKYYKNIKCPILFLPSDNEWEDQKVMGIINEFGYMAGKYEIKHIEGSVHALAWMQFPDIAGKIVNDFITGSGPR